MNYPLAGRIGVYNSPFDFFEIGAFCWSNFRLAPRPLALSLAIYITKKQNLDIKLVYNELYETAGPDLGSRG